MLDSKTGNKQEENSRNNGKENTLKCLSEVEITSTIRNSRSKRVVFALLRVHNRVSYIDATCICMYCQGKNKHAAISIIKAIGGFTLRTNKLIDMEND